VQAAITAPDSQLPVNLPIQPTFREVNPADSLIIVMLIQSDALPLIQVNDFCRQYPDTADF